MSLAFELVFVMCT